VIGGYALAVHGRPRYTKDIDIWLELSSENAERVVKALNDFGFASLGLSQADFIEKDQMIQLGYPPNRIDLLTAADGVEFRNCYENRVKIEIDGVMINFIDLENLKANKRATGRLQDLADLEALQNVGNIDDSQAT
jgi:hypothetical protein